MSQVHYSLR